MSVQAQIAALEKKLDHLIYLLEYEKRTWITPEEAAREIGLTVGPSREYTRILARLRKNELKHFIKGRPYRYHKENVLAYAEKLRTGKATLPKDMNKPPTQEQIEQAQLED
jgi:predicted PilT family ATPase